MVMQAPQIDWNAVIAEAVRVSGSKETGYKHDSPGAPVTTGYMHGPGGLLSYPGVDPTVYSTIVGSMGLLNELPTNPSVYTNPLYATLTGVTAETGDEAEAACDPGPTAGLLKGCMVMAPFGKYRLQTPELDITRLGQRINRADPVDLRLAGSPIGGQFFGNNDSMNAPTDLFNNEMSARVFARNVAMHRKIARQLWTGNPSNNAGGGGYAELTGLETLVATGYVDAQTNTSCPSLDSDVKNFGYRDVALNGEDLVNYLSYMFRYVRSRAIRAQTDPVRWAFVMRDELFWEVVKVWPCSYFLGGCVVTNSDGQRLNIDARDQIDLRDQMRAGRYLLLDGMQIEVILDDGIPMDTNTTNANVPNPCFASDIYLLPLSVQGRSTLFLEYFDFANPSIQSAIAMGLIARSNGPFLETMTQIRNCFQSQIEIEPRLVLRTPWLAGRLQNVVYCPLQTPPQAFPDDPYFVNGGVQGARPGQSFYNIWGQQ